MEPQHLAHRTVPLPALVGLIGRVLVGWLQGLMLEGLTLPTSNQSACSCTKTRHKPWWRYVDDGGLLSSLSDTRTRTHSLSHAPMILRMRLSPVLMVLLCGCPGCASVTTPEWACLPLLLHKRAAR